MGQLKFPSFNYVKAKTVEDAISLLVEYGDRAELLAGGQSLILALRFRLSSPEILIDIGDIEGLSEINVQNNFVKNNFVRIGALVRHVDIYNSEIIAEYIPLLSQAAPYVAHDAVRNRGTFGGSLSNAHPASEFPACVVALGGVVNIQGPKGLRSVSTADFFTGLFTTALEAEEMLISVDLPVLKKNQRVCFFEYAPRQGDYAMVGLAVSTIVKNGILSDLSLVYFGVEDKPIKARNMEVYLTGKRIDDDMLKSAVQQLGEDLQPGSDFSASAEYRLHLAKVMLRRAISEIVA